MNVTYDIDQEGWGSSKIYPDDPDFAPRYIVVKDMRPRAACRNPCCSNTIKSYATGGKSSECSTCDYRRHKALNTDVYKRRKQRQKGANRRLRKEIINAYGGKCSCCGEGQYEFLAIDHVNGGGGAHRRRKPGGNAIWCEIKKEGFPDIYQVLCHNCNMAKGFYGACPHGAKGK